MIRLVAGGYTDGLYPLALEGLSLTAAAPPAGEVADVSGGVRLPGTSRWFLVDEQAGCVVLADAEDGWRVVARIGSGGKGPCHLALDRAGRRLAVANYDGGAVSIFRLGTDGAPREPAVMHRLSGSGPHRERQARSHAHWVGFDGRDRLYAIDLGSDRVLLFDGGETRTAFAAPPGSGPRQLWLHLALPCAYLVSELASTLTVLSVAEDGTLSATATLPTLPEGTTAESLGGALAANADAKRLYVSNRGHDSIATFALDAAGDASPLAHAPTGGKSPRFLLPLPGALLVAHEKAGGVTLLPLGADGVPQTVAARADVPGAAFLGVIDA